jgi:hypothetical protein
MMRRFGRCTRIFVIKFNLYTCCHKTDDLRYAFNSTAGVERNITGSSGIIVEVAKEASSPPDNFEWAKGRLGHFASSHIIQ